jgi:hypothetical protein
MWGYRPKFPRVAEVPRCGPNTSTAAPRAMVTAAPPNVHQHNLGERHPVNNF